MSVLTADLDTDLAELRTIADTIETNGGWRIAALKVRGAVAEIERLRVVFEEVCNEVRLSHVTPCHCKYCHEETPK